MAIYTGRNEDSSGNILLSIGNGMTATLETGTTASQAYTKGAYVFFDNKLCKATTAIVSGDTLAIGTNLAQTSVGTELTSHLRSSDDKEFYFDVSDGKYGFYPSASKVASEFVPFGGTLDSITFIASNFASNANKSGGTSISYTATEDCYVFGVAAAYIANSNPGVGSITTSGGTVLLSNSHEGAYYLCVNYALIKLPRGASVTVTNTGGGGSNYSGRLTAYYAFKI